MRYQIIQIKQKNKNNTNCKVFFQSIKKTEQDYAEIAEMEFSMDLILKYQFCKGKIFEECELERFFKEQRLINAKQVAFNYASYSIRTKKQIINKLKTKGFEESEIMSVIVFLENFNLINDEEFARKYINDALLKKNVGKIKLQNDLYIKGIDRTLAKQAIATYYPEDKSLNMALAVAEKKIVLLHNKPIEKQKASLFNHLISKGFEFEIAKQVMNEIFH